MRAAKSKYPETPVLVGGGVTEQNFQEVVSLADGAIVSTSLKNSGSAAGRLDPVKVRQFMVEAKGVMAKA